MKVVQTGHTTGLLVEKGNIGVTLYTVVWPGLDLLSTHRSRWLEWTKMGPTQICFLDVCFSGNKLWITTLCPCLRTWCWTAGAPTVPCPYTKYLGSGQNKGAENIGLDENRGIGKECRYKTMEQRTRGNSQENVFGWTTKCTDFFLE